jgi:tol-pal system protein YbgF
MRLLATFCLLLILSTLLIPVWAESEQDYKKRPLDVRVDRLERLMGSQKQLELLYRMKQLQDENQQLRSLLEEQANELRLVKQQQRQLYTDLEHRLSRMEGGGDSSPSAAVELNTSSNPVTPLPMTKISSSKSDVVMVVDKSSTAKFQYGVTEREEIIVSESEQSPEVSKTPIVKASYKKQSMTKKQRLDEQKLYQSAYDELRAHRYNKARESFIGVIKKYPGGRYAHIAQYWVAESSYAQRNYEQAIQDYQLLLDYYPDSPKKAEAELKKAYSLYESGKKKLARKTLNHLLANYPNTTEAGQAKRLLKQL